MRVDIYKNLLIKSIGHKRFHHSVRVMETALELSKIYGCPSNKVKIASILHDCGRIINNEIIPSTFENYSIIPEKDTFSNTNLHHAVLGRSIAYEFYAVTDFDILNAIRYHTTGRSRMSVLEKIVYLADAIEPEREYENVDIIRKLSTENLDQAIILYIEGTIKHLKKNNLIIHKNTIMCLNHLKKRRK
jgi:predicted HD superfamily hydrolase involved in NAD metabolism